MRLTRELASQILGKAHAILERDILVADNDGLILAGSDNVGTSVPDALKASQTGRQIESEINSRQVRWCPFVYEDQTIGVFGIIIAGEAITPEAIVLLQGLSSVLVHQHFLLDKAQSAGAMRSDFIRQLLQATSINSEEIHRQADILQLNLRVPQAVIVAHISGLENALHARTAHLSPEEQKLELSRLVDITSSALQLSFKNNSENIVAYLGEDRFVVIKGLGGDNHTTVNTIRYLTEKGHYVYDSLKELQHIEELSVGIGQYYPDLGGLRKSYQDAKLALDVGMRVWGRSKIYHIKQVGMFVTLANISQDRKAELAHQILHPLLRDQQLYKTVREFLSSGLNLTEAAEKLHVHRNTLIYRLDKTKKLIGLDPRHFDDALQIKLGLMFYQTT